MNKAINFLCVLIKLWDSINHGIHKFRAFGTSLDFLRAMSSNLFVEEGTVFFKWLSFFELLMLSLQKKKIQYSFQDTPVKLWRRVSQKKCFSCWFGAKNTGIHPKAFCFR